ncbi:MAG: potassium/proton antiporter [Candidatus Kapabacteria bacterium]|nr:potassium/proton antiporter [Candidatus Kapabacteria bacterium]
MTLSPENILLIGSILLFISIFASKTSGKFGIPSLLIFLIVGMLAGSEGIGNIHYDDPGVTQFLGALALAFIIFSGGLDTKYSSIRSIVSKGILLSTLGVIITAVVVGLFTHFVLGFPMYKAMLLGAIISSTDAAAVFSILRYKGVDLKYNLRPTLELESGSNDPMAYVLMLTIIKLITVPDLSMGDMFVFLIIQFTLGAAIGYVMGKMMITIINKIRLDSDGLYPVLLICLMVFTYAVTNYIGGNAFLAVYIAGIVLGNANFIYKKTLMKYFEGIAWLWQIILFLALGLLVFPSEVLPWIGTGVLISLVLIFVARPIAVFLSLTFTKSIFREKLFLSWVGLRGAVPIVFATYPLLLGIEYATEIFNIVFFIVIISILLQGTTLTWVAKLLGVQGESVKKKESPFSVELSENVVSEPLEYVIGETSKANGKKISDLHLPKSTLIVLIYRDGNYVTPRGSTIIHSGDILFIMTDELNAVPQLDACLKN